MCSAIPSVLRWGTQTSCKCQQDHKGQNHSESQAESTYKYDFVSWEDGIENEIESERLVGLMRWEIRHQSRLTFKIAGRDVKKESTGGE